MMRGEKHLLLLPVLMILARCQLKPQVLKLPNSNEIFCGELVYLRCGNGTSDTTVTWYINNTAQRENIKIYKIGAAHSKHSGEYVCEINGQKSDPFNIKVLEYEPSASLTIKTGYPVMLTGSSVILNLEYVGGLEGWNCWVNRGDQVRKIGLKKTKTNSLDFQPNRLNVPETIFWCSNKEKTIRSNQITVRTSEKSVLLEMDPMPALVGESLTLRCLTWGTNLINKAVFYKDNTTISQVPNGDTYKISNVTDKQEGSYRCHATFQYIPEPAGPPYEEDSDVQHVVVQAHPIKAFLSEDMHCSCKKCLNGASYHWYMKSDDSWVRVDFDKEHMTSGKSGTYACRAVWVNRRSSLSNAVKVKDEASSSLLIVVILLVILLLLAVGVYILYKKRNTTGPVYEDVALRLRDKVDDKGDPEYDTLDPEAPNRKKKEGEYEPLKKEEVKEGEYHTLGMEGAAKGEGGYEALKKQGMKEGVYHTLGMEGAAGGEGGYEALKKGEMKEGVYHTLGMEGAAGGEGGYEALKKQGTKEGVYHTLGKEGAAGGEGGNKEQEENKDKEYEIVNEKKEAKAE